MTSTPGGFTPRKAVSKIKPAFFDDRKLTQKRKKKSWVGYGYRTFPFIERFCGGQITTLFFKLYESEREFTDMKKIRITVEEVK